jgi:hypothetical protein
MQSTDRDEFKAQLSILCAGFNVPLGDREEAYWKGCAKMSLIEFARCVEFALGESGPEKIPTTNQLWHMRTLMKARSAAPLTVSQNLEVASLQEQLCEYVALKMHDRLQRTWTYSGPWTYLYREWRDQSRPKGFEQCAECTGVVIQLDEDTRLKFTVAEMLADTETYQRALRNFRPGPRPNQKQLDAFHGSVKSLTQYLQQP